MCFGELIVASMKGPGSICIGRLASFFVGSLSYPLAGVNTFVGFEGNTKGVVPKIRWAQVIERDK